MSDTDLRSQIERYFDQVWNQRNLAEVDARVAEQVIRHSPARADISDREALKQAIDQTLRAFPDCVLTIESVTVAGERVVVRWIFQGTHRADFLDIPATDRSVTVPGTTVLRLTDGKIVEIWDQYDPDGLWRQLGATPVARSAPERRPANPDQSVSFGSTILSVAPAMIGMATLATILAYLFALDRDWKRPTSESWFAVAVGLGAGILVFVGAVFRRRYLRMSQRFLAELGERWSSLDARVHTLCMPSFTKKQQAGEVDESVNPESGRIACDEALAHHNEVRFLLGIKEEEPGQDGQVNGKWAVGTEYLDALKRLHRAEEAMMIVGPKDQLIEAAVTDELRLMDSNIENNDQLLLKLRHAVVTLGGSDYLAATPPAPVKPDFDQIPNDGAAQQQARAVLRDIRYAINSFRDERRDGMVRARNQLAWTGMLTAAIAYIALVLAIINQAGKHAIMAAVIFFVVGSIVGLFSQLGALFSNDSASEDCGLGRARVIYTPVLSGLAGVGGVVITALLFSTLNGDLIRYPSCAFDFPEPTPTATATVSGQTAATDEAAASPIAEGTEEEEVTGGAPNDGPDPDEPNENAVDPSASPATTPDREPCGRESDIDPPRLTDIFDIGRNHFGIVVAAVFGLAPGLLVERLQGQVKRFQTDLNSTTMQSKGK